MTTNLFMVYVSKNTRGEVQGDQSLRISAPANWERIDIPAFGFVSTLFTSSPDISRFVPRFRTKYITAAWASSVKDMALHTRFTNGFLMCGISNTLLMPPAMLPDQLVVQITGNLSVVGNSPHAKQIHVPVSPLGCNWDTNTRHLMIYRACFKQQASIFDVRAPALRGTETFTLKMPRSSQQPQRRRPKPTSAASSSSQRGRVDLQSSSSGDSSSRGSHKPMETDDAQDIVQQYAGLILTDKDGVNFMDHLDTRIQSVEPTEVRTEYSTPPATYLLRVTG